ncbi:MobF family relaxase [Mycobacteroides chelonae]|uniref:MobF family relaxase n=3 Tax=Mycobacteroides chelonae TaxID=1774 RepID=UPI000993EA9F|nr:MobF family relaxase [Mycobacteroides chelonae]
MTATVHKLTAGDGYTYLIRQVAAVDGTDKGRASLSDYYSAKGESPGHWIGSGLKGLGEPVGRDLSDPAVAEIWTVESGSEVTESQMKALFGEGYHPNADKIMKHVAGKGLRAGGQVAAARLGSPFKIYEDTNEFRAKLAAAYADYNRSIGATDFAIIDPEIRARIRTSLAFDGFLAEFERPPTDSGELSGWIARNTQPSTKAVAGYDFTFTPVKSAAALWALAPRSVAEGIEECHYQAIAEVIAEMEKEVIFTRLGTNGVAQVDTEGLIAAMFTHRDSRAGDPNLHTHVAISNKVRAIGADGVARWLAIDGRPLFKATVALSELYNTRFEAAMVAKFGVRFEDRERPDFRKRPVREIVGIPQELITLFSSRRAAIDQKVAEMTKRFEAEHGREPTLVEAVVLAQQANLATREAKKEPRSLAEQRHTWRTQALELLGSERALSNMIAAATHHTRKPAELVTDEWLDDKAAQVIAKISESRAQWQRTHVLAEARRVVRAEEQYADPNLAEKIADRALSIEHSLQIARDRDAEMNEPAVLRRRDGSSVYTTHNTQLYTSEAIRSAERRIVAAATCTDGRRIDEQLVDLALLEQAANRCELNAGQAMLVREMATSGRRVQLALAPAGSGKTTAMATLSRAWQDSGGNVIGLAPTAAAAEVLREDLGAMTDTVAKLVFMATGPAAIAAHDVAALEWFMSINDKTLIIVDEAGLAGTLELDAVVAVAMARGASVRFIGDDQQLASIAAGGVLRDIASSSGALTLSQIVRFRHTAEGAASLALRAGDPAGIGFYLDEHRVHVSADATAIDAAFADWKLSKEWGHDALLLAPTNDQVAELNERARLDRLQRTGHTGRETQLADGLRASAGDIVCSRENARWLQLTGTDFVRNGYRWEVLEVGKRGDLTVRHLKLGYTRIIPAKYVRKNVTLGYASTIDSAEGLTCDTVHTVGSDLLSRQQLYVAMTRGRLENHFYVSTAEADPHRVLTPKAVFPQTVIDVLTTILRRDGAQESALSADRRAADPFARLASAADRYADSVGSAAEDHLGDAALAAFERAATAISPGIPQSDAWPVLRKHLAQIALTGGDPVAEMHAAATEAELGTAHDPAAVIIWRLGPTRTTRPAPLPWLTGIPDTLSDDPTWSTYLSARGSRVAELAAQVHDTAMAWTTATAPAWARPLLGADQHNLVANLAVYRAATGVDEADTRFTGGPQYANNLRAAQRHLDEQVIAILGAISADAARWHALVDGIDPHIRQDPYWPHLAAHLNRAARAGVNVRGLVTAAITEHTPLPSELPAAALWWRLSGSLTPATLDVSDTRLRPAWIPELHHVVGTELAEAIVADPAWPGLVAAINAADPRWNPQELLSVAYEHLLDLDHELADTGGQRLRTDEYARLLTYRIDLFTTAAQMLDPDVPDHEHPPLTEEEAEELAHHFPDPQTPAPALGVDIVDLEAPPIFDEAPYDDEHLAPPEDAYAVLDFDDHHSPWLAGIQSDLATAPPAPELAPALDAARALRTQYASATKDLHDFRERCIIGSGPSVMDNIDRIRDMRQRADADRPYLDAVIEATELWSIAEEANDDALALVHWARTQYQELAANPDADPLDIESARQLIDLHNMRVSKTPPAERFYPIIAAARQARADAAGGADHVISHADVDAYLRTLRDQDDDTYRDKRIAVSQLRTDLAAAERALVRAYTAAETTSADHLGGHMDQLAAELRLLEVAGRRIENGSLHVPDAAVTGLGSRTELMLPKLAASSFTVTTVTAEPGRDTTRALQILHAAATSADRQIIWCSPTDTAARLAEHNNLADRATTIEQAHTALASAAAGSLLIVDDPASASPAALADLVEQAAARNVRVILLDNDTQTWPPKPAASIIRLLRTDLPWTISFGDGFVTAAAQIPPDLDPIIDQAERVRPDVLTDDLRDAVRRRRGITLSNRAEWHRQITLEPAAQLDSNDYSTWNPNRLARHVDDIVEARTQHQAAADLVDALAGTNIGPAQAAAQPDIAELERRQGIQLPYATAASDAHHDWTQADLAAETHQHQVADRRRQLAAAEQSADPTAADLAHQQIIELEQHTEQLEMAAVDARTATESAYDHLVDVAGGAEHIVAAADIDARRQKALAADRDTLAAAQANETTLAHDLRRAETVAATGLTRPEIAATTAHTLDLDSAADALDHAEPVHQYPSTEPALRAYLRARPLGMRTNAYLNDLADSNAAKTVKERARDELDRRNQLTTEQRATEDALRDREEQRRRTPRTRDDREQEIDQ